MNDRFLFGSPAEGSRTDPGSETPLQYQHVAFRHSLGQQHAGQPRDGANATDLQKKSFTAIRSDRLTQEDEE